MNFDATETQLSAWKTMDAMLSGYQRRIFRATVVKSLGRGALHWLRAKLGWHYAMVNKGIKELEAGTIQTDAFHLRGRKSAEAKLENLERDIRAIATPRSQTDPTFRTTVIYRKLTGKEARRQLIEDYGYSPEQAPSARSLRRKLTAMGFKPSKVLKSKPLKKIKETDAIFEAVHRINAEAEADEGTVRISLDTKTTVPIGNLSRGGMSRQGKEALDHDMNPDAKLVPFGIHRPETAETWLCFSTGSVTSDFMVDRLQEIWPTLKKTVILRIPL
jgi:hypothetical protein